MDERIKLLARRAGQGDLLSAKQLVRELERAGKQTKKKYLVIAVDHSDAITGSAVFPTANMRDIRMYFEDLILDELIIIEFEVDEAKIYKTIDLS